jgi:thiosulfate/3-mercaptopyruvate sulfurtransferase
MKSGKSFVLILVLTLMFATRLISQEPWTNKELMEPALLSNIISDPKAEKPYIFNIGPLANIKGAVQIGSTTDKKNLEKLKQALTKIPKDKFVVLYCGCCPFRNCPNIRPAFSLLKEMKFTRPRLLNLPQNLKVNWTDYGYPME